MNNDFGIYIVTSASTTINEGELAYFYVATKNLIPGSTIPYQITGRGLSAADIGGEAFTTLTAGGYQNQPFIGYTTLDADGKATIPISVIADGLTEGTEWLVVSVGGGVSYGSTGGGGAAEASVSIMDTSIGTLPPPTYSLNHKGASAGSTMKEGETAFFNLITTNVPLGTKLAYSILGVSAADIVGASLSGEITVGANGRTVIAIPVAADNLTEGSEHLTVEVQGISAYAVISDTSTTIKALQQLVAGAEISLYKTSMGSVAVSSSGLKEGDTLDEYLVLKTSVSKDYVPPKGASALLRYDDDSYGLIWSTGVGLKARFNEQRFSQDGVAEGKAIRLTSLQLFEKEATFGIDLNGDQLIGEVVNAVYDNNGDASEQSYGLYGTSSGNVVLARSGLVQGSQVEDSLVLMSSTVRSWMMQAGSSIEGLAFTHGGSLEVLTLRGEQYSAQLFDLATGLRQGKPLVLKAAQIDIREYHYNLDLSGDGEISLIGQSTLPASWSA